MIRLGMRTDNWGMLGGGFMTTVESAVKSVEKARVGAKYIPPADYRYKLFVKYKYNNR